MTAAERSVRMALIRSNNTGPELAVRKIVHGLGYRYRLHVKNLPGKPDLVFPSRRKIILVHGCFWHQHSDPNCKVTRKPKSNKKYWRPKLRRNVARDTEHAQALLRSGWKVLTIWECQVSNQLEVSRLVTRFLK